MDTAAPATLGEALSLASSRGEIALEQPASAPAPQAPTPPSEPNAPTPPAPDATPKSPLDAIPDLSTKPDTATNIDGQIQEQNQQPEQPVSPQKAKWEELRSKATELDKLKPELETLRKQIEELQTKPQIPEETAQELEELRKFRFAQEVESSPEWKEAVVKPWSGIQSDFKNIAEFYGVDFEQLIAAADDVNPLKRGKAIREFLSSSEQEVTPEVLDIAMDAAKRLHEVYQTQHTLRQQSQDLMQSLEAKRSMETEKQKAEREAKFSRSRDEIFTAISSKMPDIFKDPQFVDAVKKASVSDEPQEQAYQAIAAVALPEVAKQLAAARAEIAKLNKTIAARSGAQPGLGLAPQEANMNQAPKLSDAIAGYLGKSF